MGYWTHATVHLYGVKESAPANPYRPGVTHIDINVADVDYYGYDDELSSTPSFDVTIGIDEETDDACADIIAWYLGLVKHAFAGRLHVECDFAEHNIETLPDYWTMLVVDRAGSSEVIDFLDAKFDTFRR